MSENDDKKIKFMKANALYEDIGYHFCDSCKLGLKKARDEIQGAAVPIPWSMVFIAGFVCKQVSRLNQSHASKKNAIKTTTSLRKSKISKASNTSGNGRMTSYS